MRRQIVTALRKSETLMTPLGSVFWTHEKVRSPDSRGFRVDVVCNSNTSTIGFINVVR